MDANDVSGSSYVHITAQQDLPAKKKCIAEMQQQTDAEPSSSAAAIVFDSKWTQEGPAIDIFESRSNRGHFYFPTLAGKGPPKWVVLYYRLDPGQSAQMLVLREAHPVDPTTIYASEQDSGFRHRVRHIQYVRKDNPNC